MAKKSTKGNGINKSQAIRDALKKTPGASPKELSAELKANGIEASPAYVSMIKFATKVKRGKRMKAVRGAKLNGDRLNAADLLDTKKLVDQVGGIEKAQSLLETLKKLM